MADPRTRAEPVETVTQAVHNLVVPVEGSTQELLTHHWAARLASAMGASIRAVHVATGPDDPPEDVFAYLKEQCRHHGVPFQHVVLHGKDVAGELCNELDPTDLVVIGTRLLGTEYHLGSVTEQLIRRAPCPVQVVRLR